MRFNARASLAFLILAMVPAWSASAQTVVLSNLGSIDGDIPISNGSFVGVSFQTSSTGPFMLSSVTLRMGDASIVSGNDFQVRIFSDDGNRPDEFTAKPMSMLVNGLLVGSTDPTTAGDYTYVATNLTLAPDTYYWIVASATGSGQYDWTMSALGDGAGFTGAWLSIGQTDNSDDLGVGWAFLSSYPPMFAISAVPEPSTYAMFAGVSALGLAMLRRRKLAA